MRRLRHSLIAVVLLVPLGACDVAITYDPPERCPEGQVHASDTSLPEGQQMRCVRVDADGNHFPDGVGPRYRRYVFTTETTRDAMLAHLARVGYDLSTAQIPDDAPAPWSVYCVGDTCTFEPGRGW